MKIIAITDPKAVNNEAKHIQALLQQGFYTVHIRKEPQYFKHPTEVVRYLRTVLEQLSDSERKRLIIHNEASLYYEFNLKGIHCNHLISQYPTDYKGFRTRSCHSLAEVEQCKTMYDYVFLSPIFNSISKKGYCSHFTALSLLQAAKAGIIDHKVMALGGVTLQKLPLLQQFGFGGAAMMGAIGPYLP